MKVLFKPSDKLTFEIEGAGQKEIFKGLAMVQEVFSEAKCGVCGSENIKFVVRTVEGNDYYELRCMDCGAALSFGQHKKGDTLFPKRKDEKGNWLENGGWHKWNKDQGSKK
tara:strand:- start:18403 stop:18735 length:333 start_codon:yes stop_codon:yes gene_type:complete